MKQRCYNPKNSHYYRYGGRAIPIKICPEWLDFWVFAAWADSSSYAEGLTIDRIDNDLGYFPENCRWSTVADNIRNRKPTEKHQAARGRNGAASSTPIVCSNGQAYSSIHKAARALALDRSHIAKTLKGEYKQTGGFTFAYAREPAHVIEDRCVKLAASVAKTVICTTSGATYSSSKEAALALGLRQQSVDYVLRGIYSHTKGFTFAHVGEPSHITNARDIRREREDKTSAKAVVCKNTRVVYPSGAAAARALGLHASNITAVIKGRYNHAGGLTFAYAI
jgi:hypothetical protein